jgi:hypothetical protein
MGIKTTTIDTVTPTLQEMKTKVITKAMKSATRKVG